MRLGTSILFCAFLALTSYAQLPGDPAFDDAVFRVAVSYPPPAALTNAQKLNLPTTTPIGTEVLVTDWVAAGLTGPHQRLKATSTAFVTYATQTIAGAGSSEVNAASSFAGYWNGRPFYVSSIAGGGEAIIFWSGAGGTSPTGTSPSVNTWNIGNYYESTDDVARPDLVTTWTENNGDSPPPVSVTPSGNITQGQFDAGLSVSGAGDALANVVFANDGTENGFTHYAKPGDATREFYFAESAWQIYDNEIGVYYSVDLVPFPFLIQNWEALGTEPFPTVTRNDVATEANWEVIP